jgi:hypothetical protein
MFLDPLYTTEIMDNLEDKIFDAFFSAKNMQRTIAVLCESNKDIKATTWMDKHHTSTQQLNSTEGNNIIVMVVKTLLTSKIQLQYVSNGILLFKGKDMVYPYHYLSTEQRELLLTLLTKPEYNTCLHKYEFCIHWRRKNDKNEICVFPAMNTLTVLHALCDLILFNNKIKDQRKKLAICNIILQRINCHVVISNSIQKLLNEALFAKGQSIESNSSACAVAGSAVGKSDMT